MLLTQLLAILVLLVYAVIAGAILYLFVLIVKALRKYIRSQPVRREKQAVCKSLGQVLKEHRLRCKMTQEFVAEALGVSRQAVSKWENGSSDPSTSNINCFGQTLRRFLGRTAAGHPGGHGSVTPAAISGFSAYAPGEIAAQGGRKQPRSFPCFVPIFLLSAESFCLYFGHKTATPMPGMIPTRGLYLFSWQQCVCVTARRGGTCSPSPGRTACCPSP